MSLRLGRPPQNDDELHLLIQALWGVNLPRVSVCEGHISPFEAVAHAYFARDPKFAVWYASRGSGKSLALAVLGLTKTFVLDVDCTILGGSLTQSQNVRKHAATLLDYHNAPTYALLKSTATEIRTRSNKTITPLPASQTTVRGPHPPLSLLDEVDEMDYDIYQATMGQAMEQLNTRGELIEEYIVASSTWQNPDGCVLEGTPVLTRRGELPIELVNVGDEVPTRAGWRQVTHVHNTGRQECVTVRLASGRQLTCTPWHPVYTADGFLRADALTPGTLVLAVVGQDSVGVRSLPSSTGFSGASAATPTTSSATPGVAIPEDSVVASDVMSASAGGRSLPADSSPVIVDLRRDNFEMPGVHAAPVEATPATCTERVAVVTEMVNMETFGDRPDDFFPDPAMRQRSVAGHSVALFADTPRPGNAVVGVEIDDRDGGFVADPSFSYDEVVHVSHHGMVLPTRDLTVEGEPEYVASGMLVHNTFTKIMDDARDKGLPIFTWCWRELLKPHGWMSQRFIDNKRRTVSNQMWKTEYELNEPSGVERAFDLDKVEQYFIEYPEPIDHKVHGQDDEEWIWEKWQPTGEYHGGADWGKSVDKTIIAVIRTDVTPRRLVYLRRVNKRPYPVMIKMFDDAIELFHAQGQHDKTALGSVVHDFSEAASADSSRVQGFDFRGAQKRSRLLLDYITDFENGAYLLPRSIPDQDRETNKGLVPFFRAHRATTTADVYAPHRWDAHLPDDVAAMALAHRSAGRFTGGAGNVLTVKRDETPREVDKPFHARPPTEGAVVGNVTIVDERYDDVGVFTMRV